MLTLVVGLVLFLGAHSVRVFAEGWRTAMLAKVGERTWKGGYTVVSLLGFGLVLWGFRQARQDPTVLWPHAPTWVAHAVGLLVLVAFVLLAAAYVPGNQLKAKLHHPMVLSVKLWALAHLVANNTLADLVLFGSFLLWAVLDFSAARRRDRREGTVYPAGTAGRTAVTVVIGVVAWAVFAFWLHAAWLGIAPMGRTL
ncbi:NnrU family protein [Ramlibacter sp. XY19]|uniref:NnrU family protein n=1 Tax=Ramlibacter paludis TaxID=2908000 RepID=UPI0023DBD31F|nr:NnrU family protein [Ramlibacter paludis]MCG2594573.1 NnrU family protein [Ramlibacter paludis]